MKNYKETKASEVESIVCDVCGEHYTDTLDIQEFTSINKVGGYASVFGDGDIISLDICEHCLEEKLGEFIRITEV